LLEGISTVRVLGIDPGSRYLGYGIVEERQGRLVHVGHGVVRAGSGPLAERLKVIFGELTVAVEAFRPDAVAVEGVFTHKNARSALILGHARGVALLLAAQAGLDVHEYAPARVKRSVGAGGNDGKEAVSRMVCAALKIEPDLERADAYDALAVALCHLSHARVGLTAVVSKKTPHRKAALAAFASRLVPSYRREVVR
jgi:crossover junction endodeoxyribonuclease RuvC